MSVAKNIIIALLLTSVAAVVFSDFVFEMASNTGAVPANSTFNQTYNQMSSVFNISNDMGEEIYNSEIEQSSVIGVTTEGAYKAGKLLSGSTSVVAGMTTDVATQGGLPWWVTPVAITVVGLTITLLIMGLFSRWRT